MLSERQVKMTRMKTNDWRTAARYGLPFGVGLMVLGCGIELLRTLDPSHRWAFLTYVVLAVTAACAFLSALFASRATASFTTGVKAGAVACGVPLAVVFLIFIFIPAALRGQAHIKDSHLPGVVDVMLLGSVMFALGAVFGGVYGSVTGAVGAWLGWRQARAERRDMPSLPQQPPLGAELAGSVDVVRLLASVPPGDIIISPSWVKTPLWFGCALLMTLGSYWALSSGVNAVMAWFGIALFGIATLVAPVNMLINRPLLRLSDEGIAYKGAYTLWRRGFVPWGEIGAIVLAKAPNTLFGHYELTVFFDGVRPWPARFQNWQLPFSTRDKLRAAVIRYRKQIDENEIVVRGIE